MISLTTISKTGIKWELLSIQEELGITHQMLLNIPFTKSGFRTLHSFLSA